MKEFFGWLVWSIRYKNLKWDQNLLPPDVRYIGPKYDYYDGPFYMFGFWYWHIYLHDQLSEEEWKKLRIKVDLER